MTAEQRAKTPYIDYMRPIVADADTGHGGLGSVMKLAKLFAESVRTKNDIADNRVLPEYISKINCMGERSVDIWLARCWCRSKITLIDSLPLDFSGTSWVSRTS